MNCIYPSAFNPPEPEIANTGEMQNIEIKQFKHKSIKKL